MEKELSLLEQILKEKQQTNDELKKLINLCLNNDNNKCYCYICLTVENDKIVGDNNCVHCKKKICHKHSSICSGIYKRNADKLNYTCDNCYDIPTNLFDL